MMPAELEEILGKTPEEIRQLYEQDMAALAKGSPEERRKAAKRHVLHVLPIDAETAVDKAALKSLEYQIKEGQIDGIALEDLKDIADAPTFSTIGQGGGTNVFDRGFVVVSYKALGPGKVLKTFYSFFKDDEKRKRAARGQEFAADLKEYIRKNTTDAELAMLLGKFEPIRPAYSKRNIVANVFLNAEDMHEEFKKSDASQKYEHLKNTAMTDIALSHYSRNKTGAKFTPVDHAKLITERGLARNYPALAEKLRNTPLVRAMLEDLTGWQSFSHGDGLPSNTMVRGKKGSCTYTPIDFEFSCLDYPEASIAQRLVKSGIYDANGNSCQLNGIPVEEMVLQDAHRLMKRLDPEFDTGQSRKRFNALKAEHYLLWASRYAQFASMPAVQNPEQSRLMGRYFMTLFAKEMVRQGKAGSINDPIFDDAYNLLGKPLNDETMQNVFNAYSPDARTHSLIKTDSPINAERKLEQMVNSYNQRRFWGKVKKTAAAAAAAIVMAATGIGYFALENKAIELAQEVEAGKKESNYQKKLRIIRIIQTGSYPKDTSEVINYKILKQWVEKFPDQKTAFAAYLDPYAVYSAMQKTGGKTDWNSIAKILKDDKSDLWTAMFGVEGYTDNWAWHTTREEVAKEVEAIWLKAKQKYESEQAQQKMLENVPNPSINR